MNITSHREKFSRLLEPISSFVIRSGISPNQLSLISFLLGVISAVLYARSHPITGALFLLLSSIFDLLDGDVARRKGLSSDFGAAIDWIVDKYIDALVIIGIALGGVDARLALFALSGSLLNTFIKPVVYSEIGYTKRVSGKIDDPIESVGFFGRPETIITILLFSSWRLDLALGIIAVMTHLSAIQRVLYLYRNYR
ncbi:MAG TPA: CDP-alcohol phosphatidyltransferase family protein [Candidatus Syntrophoarchaeum butanivorans]|uniref:CDP-alcohol phosphatidyltransferase family protein n=1 Tax=Candidatus Syntropharchaeum butanivorans TaxID=1839936 RepID=A0A7C1B378_9EURY|nr:CDP-alcohol phosphatidyltransferase family protein [Candidatus Syntrophoarchaeum butanivorans]